MRCVVFELSVKKKSMDFASCLQAVPSYVVLVVVCPSTCVLVCLLQVSPTYFAVFPVSIRHVSSSVRHKYSRNSRNVVEHTSYKLCQVLLAEEILQLDIRDWGQCLLFEQSHLCGPGIGGHWIELSLNVYVHLFLWLVVRKKWVLARRGWFLKWMSGLWFLMDWM